MGLDKTKLVEGATKMLEDYTKLKSDRFKIQADMQMNQMKSKQNMFYNIEEYKQKQEIQQKYKQQKGDWFKDLAIDINKRSDPNNYFVKGDSNLNIDMNKIMDVQNRQVVTMSPTGPKVNTISIEEAIYKALLRKEGLNIPLRENEIKQKKSLEKKLGIGTGENFREDSKAFMQGDMTKQELKNAYPDKDIKKIVVAKDLKDLSPQEIIRKPLEIDVGMFSKIFGGGKPNVPTQQTYEDIKTYGDLIEFDKMAGVLEAKGVDVKAIFDTYDVEFAELKARKHIK